MKKIFLAVLIIFAIFAAGVAALPAWGAVGGTGTPDTSWYSTTMNSFTIGNADQLAGLAQIVNITASGITRDSFENKTITLTTDIDLSVYAGFEGGLGWKPIGTIIEPPTQHVQAEYPFSGIFDGAYWC